MPAVLYLPFRSRLRNVGVSTPRPECVSFSCNYGTRAQGCARSRCAESAPPGNYGFELFNYNSADAAVSAAPFVAELAQVFPVARVIRQIISSSASWKSYRPTRRFSFQRVSVFQSYDSCEPLFGTQPYRRCMHVRGIFSFPVVTEHKNWAEFPSGVQI